MFHLNAAKFFLDGGLENRTAALLAPYADGPGGNAPLMFPQDQIDELFSALDRHRFQIHVHCIGDAAARAALDGFAAARTRERRLAIAAPDRALPTCPPRRPAPLSATSA